MSQTTGVDFARAEDAPSIAALHVHSATTAYRDILPDDAPAPTLAALESEWRAAIADALTSVLVARRGHIIVGVVAVRAAPDDDSRGELRRLYVQPDSWSQGIGGLLHDAALARARERDFSTLSLWVLEENVRARRFYETRGWALIEGQLLEWPTFGVSEVRYQLALTSRPT
jgi:GNAT superfamily N-acetyltransferase